MQTRKIYYILIALCLPLFISCTPQSKPEQQKESVTTIVFKSVDMAADTGPFQAILKRFTAQNPGIKVKQEILPASLEEQHQHYLTNLEKKAADFDILGMDVTWTQEFAQAGWLADISHLMPSLERKKFFPEAVKAVTYKDKIYAIPWHIDTSLLYYRRDLLQKHGFSPPRTWDELIQAAKSISKAEQGMYGFVWQGKKYEGLVCNALEYIWSNGGEIISNEIAVAFSPENIRALQLMSDLISKHRVSPQLVTTATEKPTRLIFAQGKAVFMRNLPYAWNLLQQQDCPVKGKVGVCALPAFAGHESASTLGGWQLGINKNSQHPQAAEKLLQFLTSPEIQKELTLNTSYKPSRMTLYKNRKLLRAQPILEMLYQALLHARPRPLSPYYMQISRVLQPELSAVLASSQTPQEALESAQRQIERILKRGK